MDGYIDEFMSRYAREFDFFSQVGWMVQSRLESALQEAGIRAIVTSRAKSISRLRDKCIQREKRNGRYGSVDEIYEDIRDLVGVRVALYFPGEQHQVDAALSRIFRVESRKSDFSRDAPIGEGRRFSGYSALHYGIRLREESLSEQDQRYAAAKVEVQVASVLMHAWSEVEHDLVYKPLTGTLSHDEYAILDQLNGLVLAGEISLERLQEAGQRRVSADGATFSNHYELASYLLNYSVSLTTEPVGESELGRVDILFKFLSDLGICSPEQMRAYFDQLHGDLERRPLSDQLVDMLLDEDSTRLARYQAIRGMYGVPVSDVDGDVFRSTGEFLAMWNQLEHLLFEGLPRGTMQRGNVLHLARAALESGLIDAALFADVDMLRRIRNNVVHGVEPHTAEFLRECSTRLSKTNERVREAVIKSRNADHE